MAAVMQRAIHVDEDSCLAQQEYVSRLETENQGLRDLLLITNGHLGSHFSSKNPDLHTLDNNADGHGLLNQKELGDSPNTENTLT